MIAPRQKKNNIEIFLNHKDKEGKENLKGEKKDKNKKGRKHMVLKMTSKHMLAVSRHNNKR